MTERQRYPTALAFSRSIASSMWFVFSLDKTCSGSASEMLVKEPTSESLRHDAEGY